MNYFPIINHSKNYLQNKKKKTLGYISQKFFVKTKELNCELSVTVTIS